MVGVTAVPCVPSILTVPRVPVVYRNPSTTFSNYRFARKRLLRKFL